MNNKKFVDQFETIYLNCKIHFQLILDYQIFYLKTAFYSLNQKRLYIKDRFKKWQIGKSANLKY